MKTINILGENPVHVASLSLTRIGETENQIDAYVPTQTKTLTT